MCLKTHLKVMRLKLVAQGIQSTCSAQELMRLNTRCLCGYYYSVVFVVGVLFSDDRSRDVMCFIRFAQMASGKS